MFERSIMIYAFGHRSRVGKDTCVNFLETHLRMANIEVLRVSFAFELKIATHRLFKHFGVEHPIHYENHPEDRTLVIPKLECNVVELWIKYGNAIRNIYESIWVDLALKQDDGTAQVILISDCRFPNEVQSIHYLGGKVYKVMRLDAPFLDSPSDAALDDFTGWDGYIMNNKTLSDLNFLMEGLANEIIQSIH